MEVTGIQQRGDTTVVIVAVDDDEEDDELPAVMVIKSAKIPIHKSIVICLW